MLCSIVKIYYFFLLVIASISRLIRVISAVVSGIMLDVVFLLIFSGFVPLKSCASSIFLAFNLLILIPVVPFMIIYFYIDLFSFQQMTQHNVIQDHLH